MSMMPWPIDFQAPRPPDAWRVAVLQDIAKQAIDLNDRLLAERAPRGKKARKK